MQRRNLLNRKSIWLKGWDYRNPGLYFITICTKNRAHHLGQIRDGIMGLSVPGCIAWHFWREIPKHQENVLLDEFVVMPDHLHGIVGIESAARKDESSNKSVGTLHATSARNEESGRNEMSKISPEAGSLSAIMRSYKGAITKWCNANGHKYFGWQSRFYDHIIRNEKALHRIRKYIRDDPLKWQEDQKKMNENEIYEQAVGYMVKSK